GLVADVLDRREAGANGRAVEVHRASAAESLAAPEFRAGHAEHVAQHPQERRVPIDIDALHLAVYVEPDHGVLRCSGSGVPDTASPAGNPLDEGIGRYQGPIDPARRV